MSLATNGLRSARRLAKQADGQLTCRLKSSGSKPNQPSPTEGAPPRKKRCPALNNPSYMYQNPRSRKVGSSRKRKTTIYSSPTKKLVGDLGRAASQLFLLVCMPQAYFLLRRRSGKNSSQKLQQYLSSSGRTTREGSLTLLGR